MTDRELLESLQAQITAHLSPPPPPPDPDPEPEPEPEPEPVPTPTTPRIFVEAQGHFSLGGNLDTHSGITHTHVGLTVPLVWAGTVTIPVRVIALHLDQGSIFDALSTVLLRGITGGVWSLPSPLGANRPAVFKVQIDKHLWEYHTELTCDVSKVANGSSGYLEVDADFLHPGLRTEKTRIQVSVRVDNSGATDALSLRPFVQAEWATVIPDATAITGERNLVGGYPSVRFDGLRVLTGMPSRPVTVTSNIAVASRAISTVVLRNPDLHTDPLNWGTVLKAETAPVKEKTKYTLADPQLVAGDRIVARVSDRNGPNGHGAVLCAVKVA